MSERQLVATKYKERISLNYRFQNKEYKGDAIIYYSELEEKKAKFTSDTPFRSVDNIFWEDKIFANLADLYKALMDRFYHEYCPDSMPRACYAAQYGIMAICEFLTKESILIPFASFPHSQL